MDDYQVWLNHPSMRHIYNKLDLSLKLGYNAGPAGVPVPVTGEYVVRPIINLSGMGATAYITELKADQDHDVPPGYFWCERFTGDHVSINYNWRRGELIPLNAAQGWNSSTELYRFSKWKLLEEIPDYKIPDWISCTMEAHHINIEYIDGKIIEIHGRHGFDFPFNSTEIIPVFEDTQMEQHMLYESSNYTFIENYEDADKTMQNPRIGFYYR